MRIYPAGATPLVKVYLGREGVSLKISQVEFLIVWVHPAFPSHQDPDFPCAERLEGHISTVVFTIQHLSLLSTSVANPERNCIRWQGPPNPNYNPVTCLLRRGIRGKLRQPDRKEYIISLLHMNLQVANFQRCKCVCTCPITWLSSHVWHTSSCVCILYKWLRLCVVYLQ